MVRRGHHRVSKKTHSNTTTPSSSSSTAIRHLEGASTNQNHIDLLKQHGIEACPQCQAVFVSRACRPVQEACGHIKCRSCFINNDDGCPQCKETENPYERNGNLGPSSSSSRQNDIDLMPPLLTVEESPCNKSNFDSLERGVASTVEKELPPLLTSVTPATINKSPLKRKQSIDYSTGGAPTKLQKTNFSKSGSTNDNNNKEELDTTLSRRKSNRRPSFNSTTSSSSSSSTRTVNKTTAKKLFSNSSSKSYFSRKSEPSSASGKKSERNNSTSSSGGTRKSHIIMTENYLPTSTSTTSNIPIGTFHKNKTSRLNSLRSSTGSSSSSSNSLPKKANREKLSSSSSPERKTQTVSTVLSNNKSRLSHVRKETHSDDKTSSFGVSISPTTLRSSAKPGSSSSSSSKLLMSPSKNSTNTNDIHNDEMSITPSRIHPKGLSRSNTSSTSSSSSEGSNSSSSEAGDANVFLKDDWSNSNSEEKCTKPEAKKKKKRSPVTIHEHITVLSEGDPLLYQCNVCMKKFKTKAHIKYHEFCQNGEKPYKCSECGQGFIAKSHYEYHLRTHTGERPYKCPTCFKGFNQRGKVTRHMRSHTGEKPFICQQCSRGFANAQALRSHLLIHTGERPFACQYCNKRFTGMTNLKKHVITHTGERPFSCNHCGKSFGLKWTLDLHLRTHSTERPFACDQCSRAFSNSKDLRRHLVIHSGLRPFKCWICGTAFRRKDNLDRHIKNTHNQPREVAKQLANEAAAEYMAMSKNQTNQYPKPSTSSKSHDATPGTSSKVSIAGRSGKRMNSRNVSKRLNPSDLSPSSSPSPNPESEVQDLYLLPNGQNDIDVNELDCNDSKTEQIVDSDFDEVKEFDGGLAELRTVPSSEWHKLEGLKMLQIAKNNGDSTDNHERAIDGLDTVAQEHEVVFHADSNKDASNFGSSGLTVTVLYEESQLLSINSTEQTKTNPEISNNFYNTNHESSIIINDDDDDDLNNSTPTTLGMSNVIPSSSSWNPNFSTTTEFIIESQVDDTKKKNNTTTTTQQQNENDNVEARNINKASIEESIFINTSSSVKQLIKNVTATEEKMENSSLKENSNNNNHITSNIESDGLKTRKLSCNGSNDSNDSCSQNEFNLWGHENHSLKRKKLLPNGNDKELNQDGCRTINNKSLMNGLSTEGQVKEELIKLTNNTKLSNYIQRNQVTVNMFQIEQNTKETSSSSPPQIQHEKLTTNYPTLFKGEEKTLVVQQQHVINECREKGNSNIQNPRLNESSSSKSNNSSSNSRSDKDNYTISNNQFQSGENENTGLKRISLTQTQKQMVEGSNKNQHEPKSTVESKKLCTRIGSTLPVTTSKINSLSSLSPSQVRIVNTNTKMSTNQQSCSSAATTANTSSSFNQSSPSYSSNKSTRAQDLSILSNKNVSENSNFRFIYNPEESHSSSSSASSPLQPSFRFVYSNGEPVSDDTELSENKMRIVYARASATAEPQDSDSNEPQKVRLVFAEAFGIGTTPDDSGQLQLVYTSTTPNQQIFCGPNQNVKLSNPKIISADSNAENIQRIFAQQQATTTEDNNPVPIEVLYKENGTVLAQTVGGQPEGLNWIKQQDLKNCDRQEHPSSSSTYIHNPTSSCTDLVNHHNYAAFPSDTSKPTTTTSSSTSTHTVFGGETHGLHALARAAERRSTIEAEADAQQRAAAAIAAVGQEARNKRHQEIQERVTTVSHPFKKESIPHQGPRKRYLSQYTNSQK